MISSSGKSIIVMLSVLISCMFSAYSGGNFSVYDLAPTVVKDVVAALLTRKNWHLLLVFACYF